MIKSSDKTKVILRVLFLLYFLFFLVNDQNIWHAPKSIPHQFRMIHRWAEVRTEYNLVYETDEHKFGFYYDPCSTNHTTVHMDLGNISQFVLWKYLFKSKKWKLVENNFLYRSDNNHLRWLDHFWVIVLEDSHVEMLQLWLFFFTRIYCEF